MRSKLLFVPKLPAAKLIRFAGVGAVSGALYALGTTISIRGLGVDGGSAVVLGYALALPFNFMAHRRHTSAQAGYSPPTFSAMS